MRHLNGQCHRLMTPIFHSFPRHQKPKPYFQIWFWSSGDLRICQKLCRITLVAKLSGVRTQRGQKCVLQFLVSHILNTVSSWFKNSFGPLFHGIIIVLTCWTLQTLQYTVLLTLLSQAPRCHWHWRCEVRALFLARPTEAFKWIIR